MGRVWLRLAKGLGRGWGGVVVVLDSAGSAQSSRPEPPLAWGLTTATRHSLLRAHAATAKLLQEGRTPREKLTTGDTLFLGAGLANVRYKGQGACKKAREKEPGPQMDPSLPRHGGLMMGLVGAQLDCAP